MNQPYVGVTGFMTSCEVICALNFIPDPSNRKLMVGVLASRRTLFCGLQNKWPNRYPDPREISEIFQEHPRALNLVHYNTDEQTTLFEQMLGVTKLGGTNFHGFQLNIAWPLPHVLKEYRGVYPEACIVLQIGGRAFKKIDDSPAALAEKVANEYLGLVDYLLLDTSGGYGNPFDPVRIREYLEALEDRDLEIGLGVAGGLSSTTMNLVEPLADDFPNLSIDAESRLRDKDDLLNLSSAENYVNTALQLFQEE